jgi:peptide/nickel transport system substrate-binding protein
VASYWDKLTKERVARRRLLRAGASLSLGGAALALVGCGDDDDDGDGDGGGGGGNTPGPSATQAPSGQPKAGGSVTWGQLADLPSLEMHLLSGSYDTLWQAWEGLVEYDTSFTPQPLLAESWEVNDDATEFVFHLREGVKFHNGRDFTSEDVRFNLERVADPDTSFAQLGVMGKWFTQIDTPDPTTVVLGTGGTPRPASFDFFYDLMMTAHEAVEEPNPLTTVVGTGAYIMDEWRPGDQFHLMKFADYWNNPRGYFDEQTVRVGIDAQTMVQQFEAGAIDLIREPPARDFVRWRDSGDYQALRHESTGGNYTMGYNSIAAPDSGAPIEFRDKRVRQAMNWAINRDYFAETVLLGTAQAHSLPWPSTSPAFEEEKDQHYTFDLDKARALLDEAGVDEINCGYNIITNPPALSEFAEVYQADVAKIGINIEIVVHELSVFIEKINADPPNYDGIFATGSTRANITPINFINLNGVNWGSTPAGEIDGITWADNNTGYYSEEYAQVVIDLNKATDPEEQKELYSVLNDVMLSDTWIAILATRPPLVGVQNRVQGVVNFPVREGFDVRDAWIES